MSSIKLIISIAFVLFFGISGIIKLLQARKMSRDEGPALAAYRKKRDTGRVYLFIAVAYGLVQSLNFL